MIKKVLWITAACIILSWPFSVYPSLFSDGEDEPDIHEAKQRCEHFGMNLYGHFDTKRVQSYSAFYHQDTGKCYIVISNRKQTEKYLFEVEEDDTVLRGIFIQNGNQVDFCIVSNKIYEKETDGEKPRKSYAVCRSKTEWDKLAKPYMEE